MSNMRSAEGFTLVELMVAIAVLAILVTLAIPSFNDFRQRAVVRGAADQVVSFWGNARFAALRENRPVRVTFNSGAGVMCIGATTAVADCECSAAANSCDIGTFPAAQSEWRGARAGSAPTLGGLTGARTVVIDPKRGNITTAATAGRISLRSPPGGNADYLLDVFIDRNGRATACEPATATSKLPQFTERRC